MKADVNEETFELAKGLTQESSVFVTGVVQEDTRSRLGYELLVTGLEVIGESHEYPITPKRARYGLLNGPPSFMVTFNKTTCYYGNS